MAADHLAVNLAQLFEAGVVLAAVQDVPRHAHHVLRPGTPFGQHRQHIAQGLRGLGDEIIALELLLRIPANLAANKDLGATCGHAVGVALGRHPAGRMEVFHGVFSLKRCSLPVSVRGSLSRKVISRGYL